ncbi:hypothetical protein GUJ93_ZPchr0006g42978 [Zizania palustris]|uniref:Uncharacterized protein n=1 Tax=Zizania palustris TaxID=103762 RepID=A0A8J5VQT6_ZIZPA|nr:hypothetical protein GUJ93_ZPchr0006g42978 [Zizania palustris]
MASWGVYYPSYYQPAPYDYGYGQPVARGGGGGAQRPSAHVFLLLATLLAVITSTLYARCESVVENLLDQLRIFLILSPLMLIVGVQVWAASTGGGGLLHVLLQLIGEGNHYWEYSQYGRRWHGVGASSSSPWGVALVLVLVLFLVCYQSSFQNRWFPLLSR